MLKHSPELWSLAWYCLLVCNSTTIPSTSGYDCQVINV